MVGVHFGSAARKRRKIYGKRHRDVTVTKNKVLKVSDTGIGIAPEDLPRIFEKGFTGYNGRAEKKSTGLGMYLSRRAADMLGHTLSVQSAPGAGSTFLLDMKESNLQVE